MLPTLFLTLLVLMLFFAGLGIRILVLKKGEFKGTCASQSPFLKNQIGDCQMCGKPADEQDCRLDEDDPHLASA